MSLAWSGLSLMKLLTDEGQEETIKLPFAQDQLTGHRFGTLSVRAVYLQLVIEAQLDVRHAGQEDFHDHLAIDITPQHAALVGHQHVHGLDNIQEDLILLVPYAVLAPSHRSCHLRVITPLNHYTLTS